MRDFGLSKNMGEKKLLKIGAQAGVCLDTETIFRDALQSELALH